MTLAMWTIYHDPKDFPGKYVVRQCDAGRGVVTHHPEPLAVVDSLEGARLAVPPGLACLPRDPLDDPVIVEVWV